LRDIINPLAVEGAFEVEKREREGVELADEIDVEQQTCDIMNNCPPHTVCENGRVRYIANA
jgi:hypothetical protein